MYECVEAALNSLGFPDAYLKAFTENEVDDESLVSSFESGIDLVTLLAGIIPPLGRRAKFIGAFKAQVNSGGVAGKASESGNNDVPGSAAQVASIPPKCNNNMGGRRGSGAAVQFPQSISRVEPVSPPWPAGGQSPPDRTSNNDGFSMQGHWPSYSHSGPTSVQITEFEGVQGGTETRKAILFENEFSQVIGNCDHGRPVAALAITGKANKGKSLFLTYILRYLKALQQGNQDWMGWNDRTAQPLEGFRWANGYEVVTKGIWIWSEPITCKNSKGEEFDILLMDTQGVFDEKTGEREWNILAGLGILTSSVMILNTSNDVQEDTLKSFQNFLSFGLLALDRDDSSVSTKPFQNLVFLVRDWENHEEFPFGNQGGRRFIRRKLEEKSDHDTFHRKLRKQMKECFEDINCFLLPYPGKSARERSFTGSVINASEDFRCFAKEIQKMY